MERAGEGPANKGHEAAEAAVKTARALRGLRDA
jgi:6,7-dimethyl-8-ribityllumazine synthase